MLTDSASGGDAYATTARSDGSVAVLPDVTGDRIDDVFQTHFSPRRYVLRDGHTGRVLWSLDASDLFYAQYSRDSHGRMLIIADEYSANSSPPHSAVIAFDARGGVRRWQHESPSSQGDMAQGFVELNVTFVSGSLVDRSGVSRVLIGTATDSGNVASTVAAVTPAVLDSSSGGMLSTGLPMTGDDLPSLSTMPDMTGDGIADYTLSSNGTERQVSLAASRGVV